MKLSIEEIFYTERQLLSARLEQWVKMSEYFAGSEKWPDGRPKLWCNVAARDFLDSTYKNPLVKGGLINWYDYDLTVIGLPIKQIIRNTTIIEYQRRLNYNFTNGKVRSLPLSMAVDYAYIGVPVHVINREATHEAILSPASIPVDLGKDTVIIVAQHGVKSGLFDVRDTWSFGTNNPFDLNYYIYPKRRG